MSPSAARAPLLIQRGHLSQTLLYKKYAIVNKGIEISSIIILFNITNTLIIATYNHDNLASGMF